MNKEKGYVKRICFYSRVDSQKTPIKCLMGTSRLEAAKHFALRKDLDLKTFLKIFAVVSY
jgi:hypothetical protein